MTGIPVPNINAHRLTYTYLYDTIAEYGFNRNAPEYLIFLATWNEAYARQPQ